MKCINGSRSIGAFAMVLLLSLITFAQKVSGSTAGDARAGASASTKRHLIETYGKLPISFEANTGQTNNEAKFVSRGSGYALFLTRNGEAVLALQGPASKKTKEKATGALTSKFESLSGPRTMFVLKMKLIGGAFKPEANGLEQLPGHVNYLIGSDPKKWRTNVPTYARVNFHDVYPGVDLAYYGNQRQLEYDFVVAPQADANSITMAIAGAELSVDGQGNLILKNANKEIRFQKPVTYQEVAGVRSEIPSAYVLKGPHRVGFQVAAYDRSRPLIIDPVLAYSTYLGGSFSDNANGVAVDAAGNAYLTGTTNSPDFPTTSGAFETNALPPCSGGGFCQRDAFVTKLNADGSALVYSTFLGGSSQWNFGNAIAVDAAGNAYVTGKTCTTDFPTTSGAFQTANRSRNFGYGNAFVTKLNADGSGLVYSTYLGGSGAYPGQQGWQCNYSDTGFGIALDSTGNAYVTGNAGSIDFPTTPHAFQTSFQGLSPCCTHTSNAFVTKLNAAGSALVYSTYVGGTGGWDAAFGIALSPGGAAFITGFTNSPNFPTTPGAFQSVVSNGYHAFVSKLNPVGSQLVYSTYLAGSGPQDTGLAIAVDSNQDAYVTGNTFSVDFPTTPGAFQSLPPGGGSDGFVTKLNDQGTGLIYSTYFGGLGYDNGNGIAVDSAGDAFVTGYTSSINFPTTVDAIQLTTGGGPSDAFVMALNPQGTGLVYSSYLSGGGGGNAAYGIALDTAFNAYVVGWTQSPNFPTTSGAYQTVLKGSNNAFVTKISGIK